MKKIVLISAITLVSTFAQASWIGEQLKKISSSTELVTVEAEMEAQGYELYSIEDTGARYRCACSAFNITFKNDQDQKIVKSANVYQGKVTFKK